MEKRAFKDKVYTILANLIKAISNPHRLEIIDLLAQGEKTVENISTETSISVANASQHLQVLKSVNLVDIRREGNFIYYRLSNEEIYKCWMKLRDFGTKHVSEMDKVITDFRQKRNSLEAVEMEELLERMQSKKVVLLDVRSAEEFKNGRIPGAKNIPINNLENELDELSKTKEYIAYCRGPFCVFADEAIQLLKKKGFKAKRLGEGFADWKFKGMPVEWTIEN
jgi:rhodanese-related sulfurtransferase/predicted transcriptional regulator